VRKTIGCGRLKSDYPVKLKVRLSRKQAEHVDRHIGFLGIDREDVAYFMIINWLTTHHADEIAQVLRRAK